MKTSTSSTLLTLMTFFCAVHGALLPRKNGPLLLSGQQGNNTSAASPTPTSTTSSSPSSTAPTSTSSSSYASIPVVPAQSLGAQASPTPSTGTHNISSSYVPIPAAFVQNPNYNVKSDFDWQSIALAAHQEDIERAVFEFALDNFTLSDYADAGLNETDRALIAFFAEQEINHKTAFANMLGDTSPAPCMYRFPFSDVRGFIEYAIDNTRWGESGTIGWIPLLDNRASGNIAIQAITTESRQQYTFRQWRGLFPTPVAFEPAIPQFYHWTLLSRDIVSCPSSNRPLAWPILPALSITNQPAYPNLPPRITQNDTGMTAPGQVIQLAWDAPGRLQGPYNQTTSTNASAPSHALIFSQLNATAVPLNDVNLTARTASIRQPFGVVFNNTAFDGVLNALVNGSVFISLVDDDSFYSPANISLVLNHTVAGPGLFHAS